MSSVMCIGAERRGAPYADAQYWGRYGRYGRCIVKGYPIDVFKVHLDKFWAQQEVMFDWTADLTGTGDRSQYTVESY